MANTEDQFWESILNSLAESDNPNYDSSFKPTSFIDTLSPIASKYPYEKIADNLFQITVKAEPSNTLQFLQDHPSLSLITIATGFSNELQLLHNFFPITTDHTTDTHALHGLGTNANIAQVIPSRLLNKTSSMVPSIETLCTQEKLEELTNTDLQNDDLVSAEISNAIIIPPEITLLLAQNGISSATSALSFLKDKIALDDSIAKTDWERSIPIPTGASQPQPQWQHDVIKKYALLLQTLYCWSKLSSPRSQSSKISQNDVANDYLNNLISKFPNNPHANPNHTQPDVPDPFTNGNESQTTTTNPGATLPPEQLLACQALGLDPKTYALMSLLQTQKSQEFTLAMNKISGSIDNFSNATAASISSKDKLPKVLVNSILNAMTPDGENPATELTQTMKDLMSGSVTNASAMLDVILHKHSASASPNPQFIKGIKNGVWTFPEGKPENVTILNLPLTHGGTPLENVDYAVLKEQEELGKTLSEKERKALYGSIICPSRSIFYLLSKVKAYHAVVAESYGPESPPAAEAENWVTFITVNATKLMARQSSLDRDLPARLECMHADQFNSHFSAAKLGVPSLCLLDGDQDRQKVLRGLYKPDIPTTVYEVLHPPKPPSDDHKRKLDDPSPSPSGPKRSTFSDVSHTNQPRELKLTQEKFKLVVQDQITAKSVVVPICPGTNCNECCKFIFFGQCNSRCPRAAAHTSPSNNKSRMDNLRKFLSQCLIAYKQNKKPSDPDFE